MLGLKNSRVRSDHGIIITSSFRPTGFIEGCKAMRSTITDIRISNGSGYQVAQNLAYYEK